jgi:hypothetical protein
MWCVYSDFHREEGICRVMGELHRLGAMWPADRVERLPPPWPSSSRVDTCPGSLRPNRLKTWPVGQGIWPIGHHLGPLVSDLCTLRPHVRYIPGVTLILVEF